LDIIEIIIENAFSSAEKEERLDNLNRLDVNFDVMHYWENYFFAFFMLIESNIFKRYI